MNDAIVEARDRRRTMRRNVNLLAHIVVDESSFVDCLVRNISDTGAMVMVRKSDLLPKEFLLIIPSEEFTRRVRIKWRRTKSIGVAFE